MNPQAPKYRFVLRYVYAMMAVVVLVATVLMVTLYVSQKNNLQLHDRVARYHNRSVELTTHLANDTRALKQKLLSGSANTPAAGQVTSVGASGLIYALGDDVAKLKAIQDSIGEESFDAPVQRIVERYRRIESGVAAGDPSVTLLPIMDMLALNIEQLGRLHANAAAQMLLAREAGWKSLASVVIVLGATLGLGALLVWRLARVLRSTLDRQARTEQALANSQERLHHVQKLDALGQLVGGVAHDFNNLLTAILGQASMLRFRGDIDQDKEFAIGQIEQAAERAAALTQQLLAFSRRQTVESRVIDLNSLLQNMEPMLARIIGEDVELVFRYARRLYPIEQDPGQMEQIVMNLVVNARDAMLHGGKILIRTDSADLDAAGAEKAGLPTGEYARLTVSDDGVGMSPETRERIFEPFFTTKPLGRGTGLGLSTVHGIVTGGAGHILVDSDTGKGTRFEIYFPRSQRQPDNVSDAGLTEAARGGPETILVVEDDTQIREFLEAGLRQLGYEVFTASGGNAGVQIARREAGRIDAIVSDVIMADMNGPQFVEHALEFCGDAVTIFISGYTDDIVLKGGLRGVDSTFIQKPFTLDKIANRIRHELEKKSAPREATDRSTRAPLRSPKP